MSFKERFIFNFIEDKQWHYITDGLKVTLLVTLCRPGWCCFGISCLQ